jgi:hypothetical protein
MRMILVALTGFLAGTAIAAAVALIPLTTSAARPAAAHSNQLNAAAMSNGMAMNTAARPTMAITQPVSLTIQHVQRGCHVWSNGKTTGAMMRLHLKQGQTLSIMDMDVDAHKMMQFAGPTHMQMGGPMMTTHGMKMTFTKKGIYRFGTRTVEMAGMTDVKTIGPDNKLRLVVTVA